MNKPNIHNHFENIHRCENGDLEITFDIEMETIELLRKFQQQNKILSDNTCLKMLLKGWFRRQEEWSKFKNKRIVDKPET